VDELSQANNDLKNLLNSTDIAIVFLDNALNVRRLPPSDQNHQADPGRCGRPLSDIVTACSILN